MNSPIQCRDLPNFGVTTIIVFLLGLQVSCAKFFEPVCRDLSTECLTWSLQAALPAFFNGAPEYDMICLDPFAINNLELPLTGGLRSVLKSGYATGLKKCVVDYSRMDGDILETEFRCNLTIKGKYKSTGRMLLFSLNGEGDTRIKIRNLRIHNKLQLAYVIADDGQTHLEIKRHWTDHSFDGRLFYKFTNLFSGSPEASKAIVDFMNENWQIVANEFGSPFVDYGVSNVILNLVRLFKAVPYENLVNGDF